MDSCIEIAYKGFIAPIQGQEKSLAAASNNSQTFEDILPIKIDSYFTVKRLEWDDFPGPIPSNSMWWAYSYYNISHSYEIVSSEESSQHQKIIQETTQTSSERTPRQINQPSRAGNQSTSRPKVDSIRRSTSSQRTQQRESSAKKVQVPQLTKERQTSRTRVNIPKPKPSLAPSPKFTTRIDKTFPEHKQTAKIKIAVQAKCDFSTKSWVAYHYKRLLEHERGHYLIGCLCALEFKRQAEAMEWEIGEGTPTLQEQVKTLYQANFKVFSSLQRVYDKETAHFDEQEVQLLWNKKIKEQLILYKLLFNPK